MVKTWLSGTSYDEVCKKCGSVYEVTIQRLPAKDSDSFRCLTCGTTIRSWNDTFSYRFELKVSAQTHTTPIDLKSSK